MNRIGKGYGMKAILLKIKKIDMQNRLIRNLDKMIERWRTNFQELLNSEEQNEGLYKQK